jgi:hypothetical protein
MKSDIDKNTFDPYKHFSRVLMQQGRVLTPADSNERDDILLHYVRTLAADLIGPHGGPIDKPGFEITPVSSGSRVTDVEISHGRYYVDGILCENDKVDEKGKEVEVTYGTQPDCPLSDGEERLPYDLPFLVYLHVWERHITAIEDPGIREVALGGPDTSTRAKVVWQVKITDKMPNQSNIPDNITKKDVEDSWDQWVKKWQPPDRGKLKAKAKEDPDSDPHTCDGSPEARYRGPENQLYRVEIHNSGVAIEQGDTSGATIQQEATHYEQGARTSLDVASFKWSRDNGSVVFPIRDIEGRTITLDHLGRDSRLSLKEGDLVEFQNDDYVLRERVDPLRRIEEIDPIDMRVTLNEPLSSWAGWDPAKHPLLRRWDHGAEDSDQGVLDQHTGTLLVGEDAWLELEDDIQIYFQPATQGGVRNVYQAGDYWLVPARTAIGDVEWPGEVGQPEARPPHGIEHHYAPLAVVRATGDVIDCRYKFTPLRG